MKKLLTFLTLLTLFFGVGWAETVTNLINSDVTGVTSTRYTDWEKTLNGVTYKGNSAKKGDADAIQLRSNENTSGIVSQTSIGKIKKVTVTWNSGTTSGRTLDIYGKNSAYSSPGDLYGDNAGTKIGSIVYGTSTELTISDSYAYIGLRSNSGAMYINQITITWETGGGTTTTYSVNLTQTTGGTISASPTSATAGQTVTLTATPDNGYEFSSWTVLDGDANEVTVNNNQFSMPPSDVEVEATFIEQSVEPITGNAMILFDTNNIGTNEITQTGSRPFMAQIVEESQKYVSSVTSITNCYGKDGGVRISTSGNPGGFTLNFSDIVKQKNVRQVIINAKGWSATENGKFSLSGITSSPITVSGTTLTDYTIDVSPSHQLTSLTVQGYGGSRTIIQSITLVFEEEGAYEIMKVCDPAAGGSINCQGTSDSNKTVSFTVSTNDNYEFEYVEVKDASDNNVPVTEDNGTYSFTMPEGNVTITAHFNQAGSLYILGQVNGNDAASWDSNKGVKMVYNNGVYTANVFVSANNGGFFAFRTVLANWGQGYDGSRWGSESGNWLFSDAQPNGNATLVNGTEQSFHLPNGIYQFTVNINNRTLVVTKVENATATISPNGGDVKVGTTATITESGLATFLGSCQPVVNSSNETITTSITAPEVKIYNSTNGETFSEGATYHFDQSQEVVLTGKAAIMAGSIELAKATKQATFRVKYGIDIDENLSGGSIGNITPSIKLAYEDDEVSFKVNPNGGYQITSVTVTTDGGQTVTTTAGENNIYTFDMPADNVTISATFTAITYTIILDNDDSKGTASLSATTANAGNTVTVTVAPNTGYSVASVTATKQGGGTIAVTNNGEVNGIYTFTFTMQADNVTVAVSYKEAYQEKQYQLVESEDDLEDGASYIIVGKKISDGSLAVMGFLGNNDYAGIVTDFTIENGIITSTEDMAIITLGIDDDTYTLLTDEGYFSNNGNLKNKASVSENPAYVYISIDEDDATAYIEDAVATTYDVLSYNNSASRFAFYTEVQSGNALYLYKEIDNNLVATPVITPGSKIMTEAIDAEITCATSGATIYYTLDGSDPTTSSAVYSEPIHIAEPTVTLKAIASKDGEVSGIATAVYTGIWVNNIAEYNELQAGTEDIVFKNPVTVQYHYISIKTKDGVTTTKSYIYVKDDSGCAYFHQPDEATHIAQLQNGDIIGAGFYGDKTPDEMVNDEEESNFFMLTNLENFAPNGDKGLADPEPETVAHIADATTGVALNNHYITIKKVKLSALYKPEDVGYGNPLYFDIDNEAHIGYNKFNIDWSVVDDLDAYYNITGIFTAYNNTLEFHPTEIVKWEESVVTLRELCKDGVTTEGENEYTISNNLMCVYAKGNSIWVKDDTGQSIWMTSPAESDANFEVYAEAAEGIPANTRLNQAYYDQSNWCEIKLADGIDASQFKGKIIKGGTIHGEYTDDLNPTLENVTLTSADISSESDYALNYYMPANFFGPQACNNSSHSTDYGQNYFYMTPKPQEYAQIVWAVWSSQAQKFIMSTSDNDNGHKFEGEFSIDLSMNARELSPSEITNGYGYNFKAIIKKVTSSSKADGDSYMVYPLDLDEGIDPATSINTVDVTGKAVKSIKYVNVAGMVSDVPFQGVNIVVTEYTDGSRTTSKMLRK